ncbi:MAG TPA: DUF4199 domain-containing protein [Chitinophagales bacterium]|nr:DUF4199 domain-containing protein [Chitinophagales bacterium]HMX04455.1 DUF4199 domain-containing protein [Chitinophagales bacterium]HMZ89689.1 DUF4199 domain-containing protein [Chitinophagales bacterium]HNA57736.1 DUF4199 domain-containing protein [Chitinophagales bacterium]HNE47191.1 DUF4199 domain-containing protein [Chitinophagales bacterium]
MKKNILTYGLISGTIVSAIMLFSMNYFSHCEGTVDYTTSMLIGYASMLLSFSLVFVGVKNYRDKFNGGFITFGKAFQIAILMVLIASTMYVISWVIDYFFFMPDFMDKYAETMIQNLKDSGASAAEVEAKTKEMAVFAERYKNPLFTAMMTYMEILPIGIVVALITSLILRKKPSQPAIDTM